MKKIYYEKKGRRYVPVSEYDSNYLDSFPRGAHLVVVQPGVSSRKFNIDPNYAALIAASHVAEDAISKSIMDASALRPSERNKPITEEQRLAWEHLSKLMGNERYPLEYCSYREAAEAGVKAMMDEAQNLLSNPTVRKSFEKFLMICELSKEHK